MDLLYPRCAGLDVHPRSVSACAQDRRRWPRHSRGADLRHQHAASCRRWPTGSQGSAARTSPWSRPASTGSLSGTCSKGASSCVLANAMHVRNIPGRKSDVKDAVWISDLLAHGLLRGSFVPPEKIQELRDLTRTRKQLVREITRHTQRIQKTLEDANVKLTEVISNVLGTSGRAILQALIAGETDPGTLVELTEGRLKAPRETADRRSAGPSHRAPPFHAQDASRSDRASRARCPRAGGAG